LLGPEDYDVAGAAVGVVEASKLLGPQNVRVGDVVLGMKSSGLHSNGYSLVRKVVADAGYDYKKTVAEFGSRSLGEVLLEPTRLYTGVLNELLESDLGSAVHAMSHITGGGIAANLARVLPQGVALDVHRATWSPHEVFRVLAGWGKFSLESVEGTWNLGLGQAVVVAADQADEVAASLNRAGVETWTLGEIEPAPADLSTYVHGAKGVDGGAVRLVGEYA
jgi:phosphoribosylformylglycinamidine cyclo-ligase